MASKTWLYTNYSKGKINLFLSTFAFMSWIISWRVSIFNETYFWAILRGKKYWEDNIMQTFHNCFLFAHHICFVSKKYIFQFQLSMPLGLLWSIWVSVHVYDNLWASKIFNLATNYWLLTNLIYNNFPHPASISMLKPALNWPYSKSRLHNFLCTKIFPSTYHKSLHYWFLSLCQKNN